MGLFWHAVVRLCRGERAESHRELEELRTITAEHRMAYLGACVTTLEGEALIAAGHLESGVATIRRALSDFRAQQAGLGWPWAMSIIAAGYAENDRFDDGMAVLSEAFAAMRNHGECQWEVELHRLRGELLASCSADLSCKATSSFREAARIARSQNARSLELRTVLSWAKHLASDEAMERLEDLYGSFDEGLDTRDLRHARDLLRSFRSNGTVQTVNPTWPDRGAGWPRWQPPHERRSETDGGANDAFLDGNIRGR
jgi:adenylate cyclase